MKTWQDIITDAQVLLGISNITSMAQSSDTEKMATLLRTIITDLSAKGLIFGARIGVNRLTLSDDSNIPVEAELAVTARLAVYSAPIFKIGITRELANIAADSYQNLFDTLPPSKEQNPLQPTGQGERYYFEEYPTFKDGGSYIRIGVSRRSIDV